MKKRSTFRWRSEPAAGLLVDFGEGKNSDLGNDFWLPPLHLRPPGREWSLPAAALLIVAVWYKVGRPRPCCCGVAITCQIGSSWCRRRRNEKAEPVVTVRVYRKGRIQIVGNKNTRIKSRGGHKKARPIASTKKANVSKCLGFS